MLRMTKFVSGMVQANANGVLNPGLNPVCVQCVRWRRKPRWYPVAKSKMFKVPPRTVTPPDERIELQRLHNNYKTHMKAIRRHMHELLGQSRVEIDHAYHEKLEEEDFERCSAINNAWNSEVAQNREVRLAAEREAQRDKILQAILDKETRDAQLMKEVEDRVKKAKEEAVTFITADNIDKAIEAALANPVDYSYAIDLEGNMHRGRSADIPADKPDRKERLQANN